MFISKDEYYNLLDCKDLNKELEKEIKRLGHLLNIKDKTCKVGAWCQNCEHWVEDKSVITSNEINEYSLEDAYYGVPIPKCIGGRIGYCNKYIHTLCSDFNRRQIK